MPTYEYQCNACGHEFELFQSMTAPVKKKCPECGKLKLARLIGTGAGVLFRGSGFYETDYRSESYKKAAEAEKKAAKPSSNSEKKSDAKSDGATKEKSQASSNTGSANGAAKKQASSEKSGKTAGSS